MKDNSMLERKHQDLPVKMYPNREAFEKLGFEFVSPCVNDKEYYDTILPEGWTVKEAEHGCGLEICDEAGKCRAVTLMSNFPRVPARMMLCK